MKKIFLFLLFALTTMNVLADNIPGMEISLTDGTSQTFSLSQIRSIKFNGDQMVLTKTEGDATSFNIDNVQLIRFIDAATAINSIAGTDNNAHLLVTDLSGKTLYQGRKSDFNQSLHGIYIINGHKVAIK